MSLISKTEGQPAPASSEGKNALIATLGTSAPVISETTNKLRERNVSVDKVIVVHTESPLVLEKQTRTGKAVGLNALVEYYRKANVDVETVSLGIDDIRNLVDNQNLLITLLEVIDTCRKQGYNTYIALAGGRKTMSSMAQFASYLLGCSGLFHVLVEGDEFQLTEQYGFDIPLDKITLVDVPLVDLSPVLSNLLKETEYQGAHQTLTEYLAANNYDVDQLMNKINYLFQSRHSWKNLKEIYDQRFALHQSLVEVVSSMLRATLSCISPKPIIEARVKDFSSFFTKYQKLLHEQNRTDLTFEDITDLSGTRVICYTQGDLERAIELIYNLSLTNNIEIIPPSSNEDPKYGGERKQINSGYQAYHYDIKLAGNRLALPESAHLRNLRAEIQITTIMHHGWSKVEHGLRYKSKVYKALQDTVREKVDICFQDAMQALDHALADIQQVQDLYESPYNSSEIDSLDNHK